MDRPPTKETHMETHAHRVNALVVSLILTLGTAPSHLRAGKKKDSALAKESMTKAVAAIDKWLEVEALLADVPPAK